MKTERQRAIIKLISETPVETQAELVERLNSQGFAATQATISRDIKELGLMKVPAGSNKYCYALPPEPQVRNVRGRLQRIFQESVTEIDSSENIVLIKTLPGAAHAVASCLDGLDWAEILGTVAGDDSIIVVIKTKKAVSGVVERFRSFF